MYFFDHNFSATTAMLLHVSLSTVRRMAEFGLSVRSNYSTIPDDELDKLITTIRYQLWLSFDARTLGYTLS